MMFQFKAEHLIERINILISNAVFIHGLIIIQKFFAVIRHISARKNIKTLKMPSKTTLQACKNHALFTFNEK